MFRFVFIVQAETEVTESVQLKGIKIRFSCEDSVGLYGTGVLDADSAVE